MDISSLNNLLVTAAILTPVVSGLVQCFKAAGFPLRLLPLLAVLLGGVAGWLFVLASPLGVLAGIVIGLSSVGLFETLKTTVAGK